MGSVKIQFFTRYIFFASLAISNLNIPKFSFGSENIVLCFPCSDMHMMVANPEKVISFN